MSRAWAQHQLLPKSGAHTACPSLPAVPPSLSQVSSQREWPQLITSQNLGFLICEKPITSSPEIRGCVRRQGALNHRQVAWAHSGSLRVGKPAECSLGGLRVRLLNCQGDAEPWVTQKGQMGWKPKPWVRSRNHECGARGERSLHHRQGQEPKD